jgi:hypothetical protein
MTGRSTTTRHGGTSDLARPNYTCVVRPCIGAGQGSDYRDPVVVFNELQTPDGAWLVQVVRYADRTTWYRLVGPDAIHERQVIGAVQRILAEAGYDVADLEPVKKTA